MLSKGGKISFLCPHCESTNIVRIGPGYHFHAVGVAYWARWACIDCMHFERWDTRLKVAAVKGDTREGHEPVDHYTTLTDSSRPFTLYQFPKTHK